MSYMQLLQKRRTSRSVFWLMGLDACVHSRGSQPPSSLKSHRARVDFEAGYQAATLTLKQLATVQPSVQSARAFGKPTEFELSRSFRPIEARR